MADHDLPPGPPLPVSVQTAAWMARPWQFLDRAAARYGDMFTLRLANEGTCVMISHPDAIKEGVRRCLGAAFAEYEMRTVLGALFDTLTVQPAGERAERASRRSITQVPSRGTEVVLGF